ADKADFGCTRINPIMKPTGIGSRVGEEYNNRAVERRVVALTCPRTHVPTVRWIAEDVVLAPILKQAVLLLGVEFETFCIGRRCAGVERKVEFVVEKLKKIRWRRPLL